MLKLTKRQRIWNKHPTHIFESERQGSRLTDYTKIGKQVTTLEQLSNILGTLYSLLAVFETIDSSVGDIKKFLVSLIRLKT